MLFVIDATDSEEAYEALLAAYDKSVIQDGVNSAISDTTSENIFDDKAEDIAIAVLSRVYYDIFTVTYNDGQFSQNSTTPSGLYITGVVFRLLITEKVTLAEFETYCVENPTVDLTSSCANLPVEVSFFRKS